MCNIFVVPESFSRDLVPPIYLEEGCLADPHLPELAMKQHHPLIQSLGCPALQSVLGHQVLNVLPCNLGGWARLAFRGLLAPSRPELQHSANLRLRELDHLGDLRHGGIDGAWRPAGGGTVHQQLHVAEQAVLLLSPQLSSSTLHAQ